MNREIKTDLENILSLISCAEDYGFMDDVLFNSFSDMIGNSLTDDEIEWYAKSVENSEGYGKEDYEEIYKRLTNFKSNYCN